MAKKGKSSKKKKRKVTAVQQAKRNTVNKSVATKKKGTNQTAKKSATTKKSTQLKKSAPAKKNTTAKKNTSVKKSSSQKKVETKSSSKEKVTQKVKQTNDKQNIKVSSTKKVEEKQRKKRRVRDYWLEIVLVLVLVVGLVFVIEDKERVQSSESYNKQESNEDNREQFYNDCLNSSLDTDENVRTYADDLVASINKDGISFAFLDLSSGYYIGSNDVSKHYAASTIKVVDALYIYTQARNGSLDLDDTIKYSGYVKYGGKTYRKGDDVSFRELVKLAIEISDNASHLDLLEYIGKDELKAFGESLGAVTTLSGTDQYGNINAKDGIIYMKELYEFLKVDDEYSTELYSYFLNADDNFYAASEEDFLHKYGRYQSYYNQLAIVNGDKPYAVVFLTNYGNKNYSVLISSLYQEVHNFVIRYNAYKDTYCYRLANEKAEN